jgi:hypothetical protein
MLQSCLRFKSTLVPVTLAHHSPIYGRTKVSYPLGGGIRMKIYCPNCRKTTEVKNPKNIKMRYGRTAIEHICAKCGTRIYAVR